jgi:hypothetical protein
MMSESKRHCLVWLRGVRGPTPQVWSPDYVNLYRFSFEPLIIALRELSDDERGEPLDRLVSKYPVPNE